MNSLYSVLYGVDTRHLHETAGVFSTLRGAKAAYDSVPQTFKAKRISRLEFANPYEPATKVVVVKEVIA